MKRLMLRSSVPVVLLGRQVRQDLSCLKVGRFYSTGSSAMRFMPQRLSSGGKCCNSFATSASSRLRVLTNNTTTTTAQHLISLSALSYLVIFRSRTLSYCENRNKALPQRFYTRQLLETDYSESKSSLDRRRWGLLLTLMGQDRVFYIISIFASVFSSLMGSAQSRIIAVLFDSMGTQSFDQLIPPIQKLLGLFVAQSALQFVSSYALAMAATQLGRRLRVLFYESCLNRDIEKFDECRTGELTHQLSQDIGSLQTAVRTSFSRGVDGVTSIISGSIYLYIASPKLALGMFIILPVVSGAANLLGVLLRDLSSKIRVASNRATGIATEALGNIHTVRIFGAEERERERYNDELERVSSLKRLMALTAGGFYASMTLGINLITLLICGYGGHLVTTGELTRGGIAAIVTQVQILERSIARLSMVSSQLVKAFRSSEHIFDLIMERPVVNTAKGGLGLEIDKNNVMGEIVFDNITFAYPTRKDVTVFEDFKLRIKPGEVVAFCGHSGSGKSTLTNLLLRFYDVNEGAVKIDGVDVRDIDPKSLHHAVGIVSQRPALFATSIKENIAYGKPDATDDEIITSAIQANAHDFIEALPKTYETKVGERGVSLSGGQAQRVNIAKVILRNPSILILDESTASLDAISEKMVQKALDEMLKERKRTTIIIAHRLSTIKNVDRIIVFDKGKVVEQGTHDELLRKGGTFSKLYNASGS